MSTIVGLRDPAPAALLIYSFARISAAMHMNVEDYYPQGKRRERRLHEKGGKQHEMPAHHLLEGYIDEYVKAADIEGEKAPPLFRTQGNSIHCMDGRAASHSSEVRSTRRKRWTGCGIGLNRCRITGR